MSLAAAPPAQDAPSSLSSSTAQTSQEVTVPGYGTYRLSPDLVGGVADPTAEDLLSAAVFSADYEGDAGARRAARNALPQPRRQEVEAWAMKRWFIDQGVAPERILTEEQSTSTVANAYFTRRLLPDVVEVIVVSSADHVHRAAVDFTLAFGPGADVAGVGAANEPSTAKPSLLWAYRDAVGWYLGQDRVAASASAGSTSAAVPWQ